MDKYLYGEDKVGGHPSSVLETSPSAEFPREQLHKCKAQFARILVYRAKSQLLNPDSQESWFIELNCKCSSCPIPHLTFLGAM